ncbi:putative autotransporter adhesin-like protein [Gillisia mitskevichiae]|uniref:Putative autotransporter adhesin-like protein n=1 Tax=Gillisia mitskevichiae TaxID=270921 RepID=A0A495PW26_9FLAO|nr:head GIN domain-containing protein [Gillisia mitskevichiae]RKS55385.1 putative autotransporter adhesin-like protein [Gillisia mitskevichiae]
MKKYILLMLLSCASLSYAQEITVELDNFTEAEITKGLKVNFTHAEENKAVITGSSREDVNLKVKNGVLKISVDLNHLWNEDNTIVNIYYKQLLKVEAKQNAKIDICGKIVQPMFKIRVQEGADVKANIEVENLYASVVTGGNLFIIGTATKQDIDVKAAGDFKGENLIGSDIEVSIAGGGTASIFSKAYVNAKVRAGGTIYIYGNPEKIDESTTFGGTIKKIN